MATSLCSSSASMRSSSKKETSDSNTPSGPSRRSRTSINGVLHHRTSKATIQSYQGSISNSSVHTTTAVIYEDRFGFSEQGAPPSVFHHFPDSYNGQVSYISDDKSIHSFEKQDFGTRNQSQSTVCTTRPRSQGRSVFPVPTNIHETDSDDSDPFSTAPSTPRPKFSSFAVRSTEEMATSSVPPTPTRPSRANTVDLDDLYAAYPVVSKFVDECFALTVSAFLRSPIVTHENFSLFLSTTRIVSSCAISALGLHSLTLTGRTPNDQYSSRRAVTLLSTRTLQRIGSIWNYQHLSKPPPENCPTPLQVLQ